MFKEISLKRHMHASYVVFIISSKQSRKCFCQEINSNKAIKIDANLLFLFVSVVDGRFLFLSRKIQGVRLWILLQRSLESEHWLRNMVVVLLLLQEMLCFLQIIRIRDYTNNPSLLSVRKQHQFICLAVLLLTRNDSFFVPL